jgi:hypothetical protein
MSISREFEAEVKNPAKQPLYRTEPATSITHPENRLFSSSEVNLSGLFSGEQLYCLFTSKLDCLQNKGLTF